MTSKAKELRDLVNATLGTDAIALGSDNRFKVTYIPTDVLPIDHLLGGGIPRGRFVEVFGDYSTLKSYIGLRTIANVQRNNGVAAIIDTEHSFDQDWAEAVGVNTEELLIKRPATGEEGIDIAETMIRGGVDLIVFDSIAAALPQDEQGKRLSKERLQPARLAALMSAACRRLTAANDQTAVFWINQTRLNVGITFGSPESLPGGRAMGYYATFRIRLRKAGKITEDKKVFTGTKWQDTKLQVGQKFEATLEKSKLSEPFRTAWFDWDLKSGQVDEIGYLIAQGLERGFVKQSGNTWSHASWKAVGREKFKMLVTTTPDLYNSMLGAFTGRPVASRKRRFKRTS